MADMEFEVGANTGAAQQGFQGIQAITNQIRSDLDAINDATDGLTEKASKMRQFWQENLDVLEGMKSILEIVKTTTQINQSALDSNLQRIQEILSSVRGLGGNMGQAMSMLGMAGSPGYGNYQGGGGGYSTSPLASQDFTGTTSAYQEYSLQNPMSYVKNPNALMNRMMLRDSNPYSGTVAGVGGGGRRRPPPPTANSASYNDDDDEYQGMFSDRVEPYNTTQGTLRDELSQYRHQNSTVPMGEEAYAASYAYKDLMNNIRRVGGTGRIGSRLARAARKSLNSAGITLESIRQAQQNAEIRNVPDPVTGQPTNIFERSKGYSDVEKNTLKIANQVANVFGSNLVKSFTKFNGYAQIATAIYGTAVDVANQVRQVTGFAQEQGQVFGETSYKRSAGMTLDAFLKSGGNLNPFFNMQDVIQAQMSGASLGLKNGGLGNYVNTALNFKQQYGLNAQQTQQILGTGLGAGIGVSQTANAFANVRQLANTTNTSTAYANQAFLQGMTSYAGMGAKGATAASLGANAAHFGAGNFVLQTMGATGTEGMGSTLNNALMAQNLGTSYLGLYAAERGASATQLATAQNATQAQILGFAGIDANADYKGKDDFFNKNEDKAMVLQMILGTMQGYQKESQSPNNALNWAWGVVSQGKKLKNKGISVDRNTKTGKGNAKNRTQHELMAGRSRFGSDIKGEAVTALQKAYNERDSVGGNARYKTALKDFQAGDFGKAMEDLKVHAKRTSQAMGAYSGGGGRQAPQSVHVEVSVHPKHAQQFTAAVKTGTQGFQTGRTAPNYQPTQANII
jgi:hypothetical protein